MARMIPSVISPEVKSNAERRIFEWFKQSKGTEDWIVLHSLGIANHSKLIFGEIDFFVLAPGLGLFALEVKGGRVSRKEGIWQFTDKYGKTSQKERGPFDQAWDGVHSLVRDIKLKVDSNNRHLKNLFFGIGVMFPDIEYTVSGSDEEQWQVFDVRDESNVFNYITRLSTGAAKKYKEKFGRPVSVSNYMSVDDVNYIAGILRGDFDRAVTLGIQITSAEKDMLELTEEQYKCIDQLDDNPRCLIRGGAGTGKTFIAVQEAIKAKANGKKVALFCYNNNLGRWLSLCFPNPDLRPDFIGTFHKFLIETLTNHGTECNIPNEEASLQVFYRDTLPELATTVLKKSLNKFDILIIDEAQDLINEKYLCVLDSIVSGGLVRGKWRMFGDFSMQAIYAGSLDLDSMIALLEEKTSFIKFRLTINCRNTKPICEEICTVTGYIPPSEIWMKVDGPHVNYFTYDNEDDGGKCLSGIIEDLIGNGISSNKITILSPVKREKSMVGKVEKFKIVNYNPEKNDTLSFSTIQGYKGLENTIIILVDIASLSDEQLMYIAFSRATAGLYVIKNKKAAEEYLSLQKRRFIK